jgi:hypothetical protein
MAKRICSNSSQKIKIKIAIVHVLYLTTKDKKIENETIFPFTCDCDDYSKDR